MEQKIISYASTSKGVKNIIEADGFQIKGAPIGGSDMETKIIGMASTRSGVRNIIEADGFQIKGGGAVDFASSATFDKHPYVPQLRVQSDYSQAQKDLIRNYNSMRAKLVEAGLLQDKS